MLKKVNPNIKIEDVNFDNASKIKRKELPFNPCITYQDKMYSN